MLPPYDAQIIFESLFVVDVNLLGVAPQSHILVDLILSQSVNI